MEAITNGYAEGIALDAQRLRLRGFGREPVPGHRRRADDAADGVLDPARHHPRRRHDAGPRHGHRGARESTSRAACSTPATRLFFTGTAVEVTPIRSVDRITVGEGRPGPITQRLMAEFNGIIRGEIADRHGWLTPVLRVERPAGLSAGRPTPRRRSVAMNINDLLKIAVERKASDLHLKVGSHPVIRVDGELDPLVELKQLMQEDTIAMAFSIMNARQKQRFKEEFEIDIAYSVPGLGRFRCNIFQQRGAVGLVLRVIPAPHPHHPRAAAAAGAGEDLRGAARPGAVHRHHRLRQVDHAGGDDRLHQRLAHRAHRHHRGPDRVPAPRQEVDRQPARDRRRHPQLLRAPCARRCARTPT